MNKVSDDQLMEQVFLLFLSSPLLRLSTYLSFYLLLHLSVSIMSVLNGQLTLRSNETNGFCHNGIQHSTAASLLTDALKWSIKAHVPRITAIRDSRLSWQLTATFIFAWATQLILAWVSKIARLNWKSCMIQTLRTRTSYWSLFSSLEKKHWWLFFQDRWHNLELTIKFPRELFTRSGDPYSNGEADQVHNYALSGSLRFHLHCSTQST